MIQQTSDTTLSSSSWKQLLQITTLTHQFPRLVILCLIALTMATIAAVAIQQSRQLSLATQAAGRFAQEIRDIRVVSRKLALLEQHSVPSGGYLASPQVEHYKKHLDAELADLNRLSQALPHSGTYRIEAQTQPKNRKDISSERDPGLRAATYAGVSIEDESLGLKFALPVAANAGLTPVADETLFNLDRQLQQHAAWYKKWLILSVLATLAAAALFFYEIFSIWRNTQAGRQPASSAPTQNKQGAINFPPSAMRVEYAPALNAAVAAERARIARDLHDDLGAHLMSLKIALKCASKTATNQFRRTMDKHWASIVEHVDASMASVVRVLENLRPGISDQEGLHSAIEMMVRKFEKITSIPCDLRVSVRNFPMKAETGDEIYRITQEALTNVARHAEASAVSIHLDAGQDCLIVSVTDNGKGIPVSRALRLDSHGLVGMSERARRIGGELQIRGNPGKGTRVSLRVPVQSLI